MKFPRARFSVLAFAIVLALAPLDAKAGFIEIGASASYRKTNIDVDAYDRKVLATFSDANGRIKAFPVQEKKFLVILRHILEEFDTGVRYPEKRVNQILAKYSADTATLRRSLVEYGFMPREGGGGAYWRAGKKTQAHGENEPASVTGGG